jgi:peptidoglycan-N-acetylglucosamine deacetylase
MLECGIEWPGGARCAACISWDVCADSLFHLHNPAHAHEQYAALSWLRYEEVGVPSVVETLGRYGIRQTFFVCAWCIERLPHMCEPIVAGGHELAHHGYMNELPNRGTGEEELQWLRHCSDVIERFAGRRPVGWRAPYAAFSPRSADYLAQEGFLYDSSLMSDWRPHVIASASGELIELPIDLTMSDWPHFAHVPDMGYLMSIKSPDAAMEVFQAELDAAYELGGVWIPIWHPHVSGRPARLLRWARMLDETLERGGIWFAPLEEIARHVRSCIDDGSYEPRVVSLPYYEEPLPEPSRYG